MASWVRAHFQRHGTWPHAKSGLIPEAPGETWLAVEAALCWGLRGLPPGSTLTVAQRNHVLNNLPTRADVIDYLSLPGRFSKLHLTQLYHA